MGHIIADRAYWDAADNRLEGFDHVPTLCDPPVVRYYTVTGTKELSSFESLMRGQVGYLGETMTNTLLKPLQFIPGVAHTYDLLPDIHATISSSPELRDQIDTVVEEKGSENITFFSGQITGSI